MATAATDSKLLLKTKKQLSIIARCSICGKKLKFARTSQNSLTCWQCMIVNVADS
jgi:hypothetical protein